MSCEVVRRLLCSRRLEEVQGVHMSASSGIQSASWKERVYDVEGDEKMEQRGA